ncbi:MAG: cell division protein SepF [Lachnospiraceae bacterium]|nr:cell division protein SepF [Lachnospiraceae bacterium]
MGFIDKLLNSMKLNDDYDDYDDDEFYDDDDEDTVESRRKFGQKEERIEEEEAPAKSKIMSMRQVKKKAQGGNNMEVRMMKPVSFDDSRNVMRELLSGRTVVMNLEGLKVDEAQRIFDIVYGAVFALNGSMQDVSQCIYIAAPHNVSLSGNERESEPEERYSAPKARAVGSRF